ncbi:MAG: MATE family efflux transporter [Planctomycetes bacterium]|nr:MATE family efflux transporter [Planctomycetota bacterium]
MVKPLSILRLTGPLIISFWLRSAFAWVDIFFAAELESLDGLRGLGDASIAAIGLALPFEFLIIAVWVGTSNGLTANLASAMGANESERIEQLKIASGKIILVLAVLFIGLAAAIWAFAHTFIDKPMLAQQFQIYATVLIGGSALTSFWAILPDSVVKAHQDTRGTMWAGLLSGFTNLALNAVFVFVFGWGILGIAISTVLGRIAGLAFAIHRAAFHERRRKAAIAQPKPGRYARPIRTILEIAVPSSMTYLLMALESMAVLFLITQLSPEATTTSLLAAWAIFDQTLRFMLMPAIACSVAFLPLAARYVGLSDIPAIRREYNTAMRASYIYVLFFVLPLAWLLGPWLADVLSDTPATRGYATEGMPFLPLAVLAATPFFLSRSVFDGMKKPRPGLWASIIRAFLFFLPAMTLGYFTAIYLNVSPMFGLCGGSVIALALGAQLLKKWMERFLEGHSIHEDVSELN